MIQNDRWKILNSVFGLMVMSVFAEIMNGFVFANATFCFLDLSKEQLSSILVFGNVRYKR